MGFHVKVASVTLAGPGTAKIIGPAIESVVGWVDKVIVIDTADGRSLTAAKKAAGKKLIATRYKWPNRFDYARNFAIDFAAKRGMHWALMLDTDERFDARGHNPRVHLDPIEGALRAKKLPLEAVDSLSLMMPGGYPQARFIHLPARSRYAGATHEAYCGAMSLYRGPTIRELPKTRKQIKARCERDVTMLCAYLEEHPLEMRWWYYLGESYRLLEKWSDAIAAYRKALQSSIWDEEAGWAAFQAARCHIDGAKDYAAAITICAEGLARCPRMAELAWLAGWCSWQRGWAREAVAWCEMSAAIGDYRGMARSVERKGFKDMVGLYEGPFDVLRFAYRELNQERATAAERDFHVAKRMREQVESGGT